MKRGVSHIEMIAGFLIFLSAVIGSMYLIKPFEAHDKWTDDIDSLKARIEDNPSSKAYRYGVLVSPSAGGNTIAINITFGELSSPKARAENLSGTPINATVQTNSNITYVEWNSNYGNFIYVIASDDIEEQAQISGTPPLDESLYNLSTKTMLKPLSYEKINNLKGMYESHYLELKKEMGLESLSNFGVVYYEGENVNVISRKPIDSGEIYGKFDFRKAMDKHGNITSIKFGVVVW